MRKKTSLGVGKPLELGGSSSRLQQAAEATCRSSARRRAAAQQRLHQTTAGGRQREHSCQGQKQRYGQPNSEEEHQACVQYRARAALAKTRFRSEDKHAAEITVQEGTVLDSGSRGV